MNRQQPRLVFFSPMCLFDRRSGAALSARTQLEVLAAAGWEVESYTTTLCDGKQEAPLAPLVGQQQAHDRYRGSVIRREHRGVTHHVFHAGTTVGSKLSTAHATAFARYLDQRLSARPADIALTYGSSGFSCQLQQCARPHTGCMVFYLANANYETAEPFARVDVVACPSKDLAAHYRNRFALDPVTLICCIDGDCFLDTDERSAAEREVMRRNGFVTFINPSLEKGGTLLVRLADMALVERPDITFLAVEGRMSRADWVASGIDPASMANVFWLPNQQQIKRVYQRTSVLLFPSFWREASGRSIAEAQLSGIPVVASNRGGIPAQLNGGGFCLDNPPGCESNHGRVPSMKEVRPWLDTLVSLLDDPELYCASCDRALEAAAPWHPDHSSRRVLDFYQSFLRH